MYTYFGLAAVAGNVINYLLQGMLLPDATEKSGKRILAILQHEDVHRAHQELVLFSLRYNAKSYYDTRVQWSLDGFHTKSIIDANVKKNIINEIVPEDRPVNDRSLDLTKGTFEALSLDEKNRHLKISKETRKLKFNQRKKKEKQLTAKHRHNLFQIKKSTNLRYDVFAEINRLWRKYVNDLIRSSPKDHNSPENLRQQTNIYNCLVKADYHGAFVVVSESRNPLLVGLKGFVIKENKKLFYLINEQNRILVIPKSGTVIAFEINDRIFKLNGNLIQINSHQRTRAKFKSTKLTNEI